MLKQQVAEKSGINNEKLYEIKNIIFDLGGVIIDIHYKKTAERFNDLGFSDFENIYSQIKQAHIFDLLETGKIPPQAFRMELRKFNQKLTDDNIDAAWSAMIGTLPWYNIPLLKTIRKQYRTFLLSNTNAIHIEHFNRLLLKEYKNNPISEMFEHTYYSYEIGFRKPNTDAYEFVLRDAGLKASETLFVDDSLQNIEGARSAGLIAYHLEDEKIHSLFNYNE
jgi:putative hydrolase of the HAD superfamily